MSIDEYITRFTAAAEFERTHGNLQGCLEFKQLAEWLKDYKRLLEQENKWIPVSEKLPDNTDPVNITWVNHDPDPYYATIKDKPFTATGCYCDGKWYWYSVTCQDYLDEYRYCDVDSMDEAIEVTAWMPLPQSYKAESEVQE